MVPLLHRAATTSGVRPLARRRDSCNSGETYHATVAELSRVAGRREVKAPLMPGLQVSPVNETVGRLYQQCT